MKRQVLKFSWQRMDKLHRIAADKVVQGNFEPELIVGVLRCGVVSAVHIAYILGIRRVGAIYARTTPSDDVLVEKSIPPEINIDFPKEEISGKRILLIDTVMASGTTVSMCLSELRLCHPLEIRTLIIIDWPNSPYTSKSLQRPVPDYIVETVNMWPDFPWEH